MNSTSINYGTGTFGAVSSCLYELADLQSEVTEENVANIKHPPDAMLLSAKQKILNRLCTQYIGLSQDNRFIPADKLRRELSIPEDVFAEALNSFINAENQLAVEVIESKSRVDLRLGEFMRDLCSNWNPTKHNSVSNSKVSIGVSARSPLHRSAWER